MRALLQYDIPHSHTSHDYEQKMKIKPESLSYQRPPISRRILPVYRAHHTYSVHYIDFLYIADCPWHIPHWPSLCGLCSMLDTSSLHPTHRL